MNVDHTFTGRGIAAIALCLGFLGCSEQPLVYGAPCDPSEVSNACDGFNVGYCAGGQWTMANCMTLCGGGQAQCGYNATLDEEVCICDGDEDYSDDGGGYSDGGDSGNSGGNESGGDESGGDESGGDDSGGTTCQPENASCSVNGECCGFADDDAWCVGSEGMGQCVAACTFDFECSTGCCGDLTNGGSACAPSYVCDTNDPPDPPMCNDPGFSCDAGQDCCGYLSGDAYCINIEGGTCSASCIGGWECASGCCAELESGDGACAPSNYCADEGNEPLPRRLMSFETDVFNRSSPT